MRASWEPAELGLVGVGVLLLAAAFTLQGCETFAARSQGNWQVELSYLDSYEYLVTGASANLATASQRLLNTCSSGSPVPEAERCGGHGTCSKWGPMIDGVKPISFCECERDWADPECRTHRKSQLTAFLWSLGFGYLGADLFYLGFHFYAWIKLCTLGGFGVWYIYDVVRIGCAPVYAKDYRVATDLPHHYFVLGLTLLLVAIGFTVALTTAAAHRTLLRKEALLKQAAELARDGLGLKRERQGSYGATTSVHRPGDAEMESGFTGHGARLGSY